MSTKKLKNYGGLYGELNSDSSPFYVYSELIEDRSGLFDWTIEPHLHAHLYQFFFVHAGKASVNTTSGTHELRPFSVVIIPPGTVHGFRYDPTVRGRIVTVADTVLEGLAKELPNILLTIKNFGIISNLKDSSLFTDLIDLAVRICSTDILEARSLARSSTDKRQSSYLSSVPFRFRSLKERSPSVIIFTPDAVEYPSVMPFG